MTIQSLEHGAASFGEGVFAGGTGTTPSQALSDVSSVIPGVSKIGDFFGSLTQASTWIRVAEVLIGLGLIVAGLVKLAGGTALGRTAERAGKAAAIL